MSRPSYCQRLQAHAGLVPVLILLSSPLAAQPAAPAATPIEEVLIIGRPIRTGYRITDPARSGAAAADSASLLARVPGANLNANGPISAQAQYRGLSSLRLNVRIDGQMPVSGGPNYMDPPLHYVPKPLLERLEVTRGVAPVSAGPGLGGSINAVTKTSVYAKGPELTPQSDLFASLRSADNGVTMGGLLGLADQRRRLHLLASYEDGDDYRFSGGRVRASSFRRTVIGTGAGLRLGDGGELSLNYRYQHTGPSGTPALPMDILKFDTHAANAKLETRIRGLPVSASVSFTDIRHLMSNFALRPAPVNGAMFRRIPARAQSVSFALDTEIPLGESVLSLGVDGSYERHDMEVTNPNNAAFFITNFNNARIDRTGFFAEWRRQIPSGLSVVAGLRYGHVVTNAGPVSVATMLPPPVQALAAAFNTTAHRRTDALIDAALNLSYPLAARLSLQIGLGRKTRSPYYVERYAWLPLEVTAGLGDGNNHIGAINLKPEIAYVADIGLDWRAQGYYASPSVFYRRIHDYIQGVPVDATPGVIDSPLEMVSAANGDPSPLRYSNVGAELYGFDIAFGGPVPGLAGVRLDGVFSYVRGQRRDIRDDLYRIAPANALVSLSYERGPWSVTTQARIVLRQRHVSRTNGEQPTPGYQRIDLLVRWAVNRHAALIAGVENLFNVSALDHLAGFNRVVDSDVALGARLPGRGRNGFVRTTVTF